MNTDLIEQNVHRLLGAMTGAATTAMVAVGDQLGLYRALAAATGYPGRTSRPHRHGGTLPEGVAVPAGGRRIPRLPGERRAVRASGRGRRGARRGGIAGLPGRRRHHDPRLVRGHRPSRRGVPDRAGIPWHEQDPAVFEGTERFFRPGYTASLTTEWVPALPGVTDRLAAGGRVADVGCGHGVAAILLARAYPQASVHGYDFHDRSIQVARQQASQAGLGGRIRFETLDATSYPADGFDLICLLDTLHDLGDPAAALAHARKALAPDGAVLVVEPNAADDYAANLASPLAALSYAASTFQCTPAALAQPGGVALGAQAGPAAVRQLAGDAGFSRFRQVTQTPVNIVLELRP